MPRRRRQRPSPEAAVAARSLFDLPLEIRWMIYKLLLVKDYGVSIAQDALKRIKPARDGNQPCVCTDSGIFFSNDENLVIYRRSVHYLSRLELPENPELPDLPHMDTAILRTCRLIYDEAAPILYKCNSFCFSDLTTADDFRWITGKYACLVQEIRFNCAIARQKSLAWNHLSINFPHLKRIRLRLSTPLDRLSSFPQMWQLEELARHFRGLDWVQIQGCRWCKLVKPLISMVERGSATSLMHVQKHLAVPAPAVEPILANPTVAESPFPSDLEVRETILTTLSWTTLWWGLDGEQTPESSRNMR